MLNYNEEIIRRLEKNKLTISICESVTGGLITSSLIAVSGSSNVVKGSLITYANELKIKLAGVHPKTIETYGAVSSEVAKEMVIGTSNALKTDIAVAITGNAGPTALEGKPIGQAFLAVSVVGKIYLYELNSTERKRNDVRINLTIMVYKTLLKLLDEIKCF